MKTCLRPVTDIRRWRTGTHHPPDWLDSSLPLGLWSNGVLHVFRIRALHAQLLEKDAVIKVIQQRSRWEQGQLERQGLHLTRSVPSVNNVTGSTESKGDYKMFPATRHTTPRHLESLRTHAISSDNWLMPDRMCTSSKQVLSRRQAFHAPQCTACFQTGMHIISHSRSARSRIVPGRAQRADVQECVHVDACH